VATAAAARTRCAPAGRSEVCCACRVAGSVAPHALSLAVGVRTNLTTRLPTSARHIGTAAPAPASCRVASTTLATSSGGDETPKPSSTRRSRAELLRAARVGRSSSQLQPRWRAMAGGSRVGRQGDDGAPSGFARSTPSSLASSCPSPPLRDRSHRCARLRTQRRSARCCNPGATRMLQPGSNTECCNPGATRMLQSGSNTDAACRASERSQRQEAATLGAGSTRQPWRVPTVDADMHVGPLPRHGAAARLWSSHAPSCFSFAASARPR